MVYFFFNTRYTLAHSFLSFPHLLLTNPTSHHRPILFPSLSFSSSAHAIPAIFFILCSYLRTKELLVPLLSTVVEDDEPVVRTFLAHQLAPLAEVCVVCFISFTIASNYNQQLQHKQCEVFKPPLHHQDGGNHFRSPLVRPVTTTTTPRLSGCHFHLASCFTHMYTHLPTFPS